MPATFRSLAVIGADEKRDSRSRRLGGLHESVRGALDRPAPWALGVIFHPGSPQRLLLKCNSSWKNALFTAILEGGSSTEAAKTLEWAKIRAKALVGLYDVQ
jgi:hypothetical protein